MRQQAQALVIEKKAEQLGKGTVTARGFADELRASLGSAPPLADNYRLPSSLVQEIEREFLGRTLEDHEASRLPLSISLLTDVDYWLEHARVTRDLMQAFAIHHGANIELYGQIGRLHDADYLRHPHVGPKSVPPVHPLPLALFLLQAGAHEAICVAIMEHAGYIGQGTKFSTRMSAALSACDDLATYFAAVGHDQARVRQDLSDPARQLMSVVAPPRVRIDVDRACPTRVLNKPDLYINRSLELAEGGNFIFDV